MLRFDERKVRWRNFIIIIFRVRKEEIKDFFIRNTYVHTFFTHKYQRLINSIDNVGSMEFFRGRKIDNLIFRISGSPL